LERQKHHDAGQQFRLLHRGLAVHARGIAGPYQLGPQQLETIETGIQAGVKRIALYHHDPYHEDGEVEQILENARKLYPNVIAAREGLDATL
jgi:hypothetical protein